MFVELDIRPHRQPIHENTQNRRKDGKSEPALLVHSPQKAVRVHFRPVPEQVGDPDEVSEGEEGDHDDVHDALLAQVLAVTAGIEAFKDQVQEGHQMGRDILENQRRSKNIRKTVDRIVSLTHWSLQSF